MSWHGTRLYSLQLFFMLALLNVVVEITLLDKTNTFEDNPDNVCHDCLTGL